MDLRVLLKLDGSGFIQGVTRAKAALGQFSQQALGGVKSQLAGLFTAGAMIEFSRRTIEFADNMRELADNLGVNVEWLQKMANAARMAGASVEDMARFIQFVGKAREQAFNNPAGTQAAAFGRMGMTQTDIVGLSQQKFVEKLVEAFSKGAQDVQAENDLMVVGGKAAKTLIGAFAAGIESAGPIMPEDLIDQIAELKDAFYLFSQTLMVDLAPSITWVANAVKSVIRTIQDAGTFLGAITQNFNLKDFLVSGIGDIFGPAKYISDLFKENFPEATRQIASIDADRAAQDEELAKVEEARRARRKARENAPPGFAGAPKSMLADLIEQEIKGLKVPTRSNDSLLAVGNFLGSNMTGAIERVGAETNRILREQTALLKQIAYDNKHGGGGIGTGDPIEVPY